MSISENATGGENGPDMNESENQNNPQDVAAEIVEAVVEDTRDAGVSEETGATDTVAIENDNDVLKLNDEPSAEPAAEPEKPENGFEKLGLPDEVIACVGGGSNAIGLFHPFIDDDDVRLIGCEAGGDGAERGADRLEMAGLVVARRLPGGDAIHERDRVEEMMQVQIVDVRDHRRAVGQRVHKPLAGQAHQRLADRGARHPEAFGQRHHPNGGRDPACHARPHLGPRRRAAHRTAKYGTPSASR